MPKFYLTTAIPYASQRPHIGNAYDAIFCDTIARYRRLRGDDVYFLTGSDEHGEKIQNAAEAEGVSPQDFVDGITNSIKEEWNSVMVETDDFIRTSESRHKDIVSKMFKKLYEQGDIYRSAYEGWYCVPDESFHTESQVTKSPSGEYLCPECSRPVEKLSEEAYFFRLSAYADRLAKHIEENPDFIQPDTRRNEMVNNFIKPGLQDFCVSRTSFKWGIPVDFDPGHVMYVWLDALSNYITALGYSPDGKSDELFEKYWPADIHVIGKDVLRFHTLYWPGVLLALGLPLPKKVFGHPWFTSAGQKMSKSLGNVLYASELSNEFGSDAVRYCSLREMPFARDGDITREGIISRFNTDLANTLGNLASRSVAMAEKYFSGEVFPVNISQNEVLSACAEAREKFASAMDSLSTQSALSEVMAAVSRANRYIDETEPWVLAKSPEKSEELKCVIFTLLEILRAASVMLYPVMPLSMKKLRVQLGLPEMPTWDEKTPAGFSVKRGENLFLRIVEK